MYVNGAAYSELYKIKYATVADYEWNTAAYNPELSLWKALTQTYGRPVAVQLLRFNDAYYGVYEICLQMNSAGKKIEYVKNAEKRIKEMRNCIMSITGELPGQKRLLGELAYYMDRQEKRLAKIMND
jgi:hypothetical protein